MIVNEDPLLHYIVPSEELDSLDPLFKLFPSALKEEDLFIHCAWHTAYVNDVSRSIKLLCLISGGVKD